MILQTGSVCKQHEFLRKLCLSDGRIQTLLAEFEGLAIRKHQAVVESPAEPCASSLVFGVRYFMTITLPVMMPPAQPKGNPQAGLSGGGGLPETHSQTPILQGFTTTRFSNWTREWTLLAT